MPQSNIMLAYADLVLMANQYIRNELQSKDTVTLTPKDFRFFNEYTPKQASAPIQTQKPIPQNKPLPPPKIIAAPPKQESGIKVSVEEPKPVDISQQVDAIPAPPINDSKEFSQLLKTHFPSYSLVDKTPDDKVAKENKIPIKSSRMLPGVVILSFYDDIASQSFLKSVAEAIDKRFMPSSVFSAYRIEQENKWETLLSSAQVKLILAPLHKIKELPRLMPYLHEIPGDTKYLLKEIPVIPLLDPSQYQKDTKRKSLLWESICGELNKNKKNIT